MNMNSNLLDSFGSLHSFARALLKTGIPELGLGDAEQTMIFNAWERHLLLWNNSRRLRNHAHFMYFFLSITAFATALFSVIYANAEIVGNFDDYAFISQESFSNILGEWWRSE